MKQNKDNPFFSQNGRIITEPAKTEKFTNGNDFIEISFYKISVMYTYSFKAQMQKRIYAKYPHPQDEVFDSIRDCKIDAKKHLKIWCDQNKLKKCYSRLVPSITDQLDLFDELFDE